MFKMDVFNWKILVLSSVMGSILFRGVTCQENAIVPTSLNISKERVPVVMANVRGDDIPSAPAVSGAVSSQHVIDIPSPSVGMDQKTESTEMQDNSSTVAPLQNKVVCVDEATVRNKDAVKLKLKTYSSCEESKEKIQSILEHLCPEGNKLEIYQKNQTNEIIISGNCVEGDVNEMIKKFDNDNIRDKIGIVEVDPILVNHSRTILIAIIITGLLLAVLLIAGYILKTRRTKAKSAHLAEVLYQVDEHNQGNTLLSVAPLPPQEPVDKPTSNGESLDSPPTNGHSATQTPIADSEI